MTEIELKLQVPPAALPGVERALAAAGSVHSTRLQAVYFDTPDRRLAAAGVALRLRREGRRWVQTLKAGAAHGLERAEHNVVLAIAAGLQPALDTTRHDGTPAGDALAAVLAPRVGETEPARLLPLYRTDVRRRHRELRTRGGAVELALDLGAIVATGPDGVERSWPLAELEIEWRRGATRVVTDVAARWAARHGLWPDTRSKAERGDRLARGLGPSAPVPAVKGLPVTLDKSMAPAAAWAAVLDKLLAHALPNWSEVAAGSTSVEAVHQLRVALRRLRSAERFFAGWPGVPEAGWRDGVAALFRALGATRDRDVLEGGLGREINAALRAEGAAPLPPMAPDAGPADDAMARVAQGGVLIALMAERLTPDAAPGIGVAGAADPEAGAELAGLRARAAARLQAWHDQALRDAKRFDRLDDEARHRLRKRLKRLRYGVEFSAGLFGRRAVERYLQALREAQEGLGVFNDICVAQSSYRTLAEAGEPRAWFALGWLASHRADTLAACAVALKRWRKTRSFWD